MALQYPVINKSSLIFNQGWSN